MIKLNMSHTYDYNEIDAYIITLKNNPLSEKLSKRCQESCKKVGMPYKIWEAFDGTDKNTDIKIPEHSKNSEW